MSTTLCPGSIFFHGQRVATLPNPSVIRLVPHFAPTLCLAALSDSSRYCEIEWLIRSRNSSSFVSCFRPRFSQPVRDDGCFSYGCLWPGTGKVRRTVATMSHLWKCGHP